MKSFISFISGIIFAVGLVISGMTNPQKVIGFLDILGNWDPSLAFVMGGAVSFNLITFYYIKKRKSPFYEAQFDYPLKTVIDIPLVLGAIIFGIGWAIMGVCPGPAVVNIVTLNSNVLIFLASFFGGVFLYKGIRSKF
tara:strand:+ start:393 stop:806 length:414 start_codon:yes stop_codon:yes gene_type:complete